MRTTISIDEELLNELMQAEKVPSRSEAIRRAVVAHLRRKRIEGFKQLAGSGISDLDWQVLEEEEIRGVLPNEKTTHTR